MNIYVKKYLKYIMLKYQPLCQYSNKLMYVYGCLCMCVCVYEEGIHKGKLPKAQKRPQTLWL